MTSSAVVCSQPPTPSSIAGTSLLGLGIRNLVVVPFGSGMGGVGVARLYDERFDEAEVALLEALAESTRHALERIRLAEERDRLYREADERGRAARVLGSVADGVFLVDSTGIIQLWNRAAETITRLPAEEVLGRSAKDAIPGWEAFAKLIVVASAPAESGGRATTVPVEIDGRELWLSIAGVGFDDGTVYAFRDLTEERHLEQLKTDFIATVSHELRTPIAAVSGAAKTLERRDVLLSEESRRDLLAIVSQQSDRLVVIVNDILLASQVDDQRLTFTTERVDVAELARRAIAAARTHAPKGVTLEVAAPPALPAAAADADKLAQVLANLVGNAVKYSPEGGKIRAWPRAAPAGPLRNRARRGPRHRRTRARPNLRKVLSRRPAHDPRRERQRPRPLHLPGAHPTHGREHLRSNRRSARDRRSSSSSRWHRRIRRPDKGRGEIARGS